MNPERISPSCTIAEHLALAERFRRLQDEFEALDIPFPVRTADVVCRNPEEFLVISTVRQKKKDELIRASKARVAEGDLARLVGPKEKNESY